MLGPALSLSPCPLAVLGAVPLSRWICHVLLQLRSHISRAPALSVPRDGTLPPQRPSAGPSSSHLGFAIEHSFLCQNTSGIPGSLLVPAAGTRPGLPWVPAQRSRGSARQPSLTAQPLTLSLTQPSLEHLTEMIEGSQILAGRGGDE